jgi:magnesium transporter
MKTEADAFLAEPISIHMRPAPPGLRPEATVEEALVQLRKTQPTGRVIYFYVTDERDRLVGVVPTRRLLLAEPQTPLRKIMVKDVIKLPDDTTVLEACEFFVMHRFLAFPVVNPAGEFVGLIDVDLYTSELHDLENKHRRNDLFQLIGVNLEASQRSPWAGFRQRFPWLLCNIAGGLLAGYLTSFFEVELAKLVALALFIPVVLALAESVAIQSVTLALQGLHRPKLSWLRLWLAMRLELLTGALLSLGCGLVVAVIVLTWQQNLKLSLIVLGGIVGGITCAAVLGWLIPTTLRLLKLEPQVAAGPIALACADMVTIIVYFSLARLLV